MDVYVLVDPRDGRIRYVGLSKDWRKRVAEHQLAHHARQPLPNSGLMAWKRELLEEGLSSEGFQIGAGLTLAEAQAMERKYIAAFRRSGEGLLNIHDGGVWGNNHVASEETRARMRAVHLGIRLPLETRARMSASRRGKKRSPEFCANISRTLKGRRPSARTMEAARQANTGAKHPHSPEALAKMAEALRGRRLPLEVRAKIGNALRGHRLSLETKAKMSTGQKLRRERERAALFAGEL